MSTEPVVSPAGDCVDGDSTHSDSEVERFRPDIKDRAKVQKLFAPVSLPPKQDVRNQSDHPSNHQADASETAADEAALPLSQHSQAISYMENSFQVEQTGSSSDLTSPSSSFGLDDAEYLPMTPVKRKRGVSSKATPQGRSKNVKPGSGRKISAVLDSIDKCLVHMKENGISNKEIVQKLQKKYGVEYNEKTVGTRFTRIKAVQEKERAGDGPRVWKDDEDEAIEAAIAYIDAQMVESIARLKSNRWSKIAARMTTVLKPTAAFQGRSVRERWSSLTGDSIMLSEDGDTEPQEDNRSQATEDITDGRSSPPMAVGGRTHQEIAQAREPQTGIQAHVSVFQANLRQARTHTPAMLEAYRVEPNMWHGKFPAFDGYNVCDSQLQSMPSSTPALTTQNSPRTSFYSTYRGYGEHHHDPRSKMLMRELDAQCTIRGISRGDANKAEVCAILAYTDRRLGVEGLRRMLYERGIIVDGTLEELALELARDDVRKSKWGIRNATVTAEELDSPLGKLPSSAPSVKSHITKRKSPSSFDKYAEDCDRRRQRRRTVPPTSFPSQAGPMPVQPVTISSQPITMTPQLTSMPQQLLAMSQQPLSLPPQPFPFYQFNDMYGYMAQPIMDEANEPCEAALSDTEDSFDCTTAQSFQHHILY